ncbi:unnamed protein product [Didymodactylos carnosus]|uniref:Shisa N-terminal domain-containing protein n=1 Tax=Didymodactylos carnosus TaxID=1234261 RepID=A0A814DYK4_9BILA|nr:unnamed protein product [Didymodactylos carnosus]CAF0960436.1 unnamed protein product [Didymodactylos carnosus]CAF3628392.1 unnamed protein product [Didymodactylos carnosus]CAF3735096.1 unnamed protein product [Didymodactylos carnosus]
MLSTCELNAIRYRRQVANDGLINPNFKPGTGSVFQGSNNNKNIVDQQYPPPSGYISNINYDNQKQQYFDNNNQQQPPIYNNQLQQASLNNPLQNYNQQQPPIYNNQQQQSSLNNPPQNFGPVQQDQYLNLPTDRRPQQKQQLSRDGNFQPDPQQRINQQQLPSYQNYPQQGQQQQQQQFPGPSQSRLINQQEPLNANQQQVPKVINNQQVPNFNPNVQNFPQNPVNKQQSQQLQQNYPSDGIQTNNQQQQQRVPPIYTDSQNFPLQQQPPPQNDRSNPGYQPSNVDNKGGNVFAKSKGIYRSGNFQPSPLVSNGWFNTNNEKWLLSNGYFVGDSQGPMSLMDKTKNVGSTGGQLIMSKLAKTFLSKGEKTYPKYATSKGRGSACINSDNFDGFTYGSFPCPLSDTDSNAIFCCGPKNRQYCCNTQEYSAEQRYRIDGRSAKAVKVNRSKTVALATVLPILAVLLIIGIGTVVIMKYLRSNRAKTYGRYNTHTGSSSSHKSDQSQPLNAANAFPEYERQPDAP